MIRMKRKVRQVIEQDLPELRRIILEAENFGEPFLESELRNLKWCSIPDLGAVYVATVDDKLAGYIILRKKVFAVVIVSIVVARGFRRRGIGRVLIQEAKEYATSHKFNVLRVDTANFMDYAIKFYLACDFLPCGYVEHDFGLNMRQVHFYMDLTRDAQRD